MSDFFGDSPEPRPTHEWQFQYLSGQYERAPEQYIGSPKVRQLGEEVSRAIYNGIFGRESQQE